MKRTKAPVMASRPGSPADDAGHVESIAEKDPAAEASGDKPRSINRSPN